jgi:hypothetical protein
VEAYSAVAIGEEGSGMPGRRIVGIVRAVLRCRVVIFSRNTCLTLVVGSAIGLVVAMGAAAAVRGSGVRVAKAGVGAYIGPHMGKYIVAVLAKSPTELEISMHAWTTCYPTHERLNGHTVTLSPSQAKSFAESYGWSMPFPNVPLSASGSFQKSETVPGPNGSHPTISGRVNGNTMSGTFSATGIFNAGPGGYLCDNVSFSWTASFDPTAQPDPLLFGPHA